MYRENIALLTVQQSLTIHLQSQEQSPKSMLPLVAINMLCDKQHAHHQQSDKAQLVILVKLEKYPRASSKI